MMKNDLRSSTPEPICKKIQNYIFKFTDMLGQGNFSKVYKAHHQITNQIVAIKIVDFSSLRSQKLEQLLFSEIDVLKKLNHPNILKCYEVFTSNRNCYIITELCNGGDLQSKLRREHHFSEQSAQPIIKDIFQGLVYLAQKNVIHRDLKVANVFLDNGRAKIADFGFAKFTNENFQDINIGSPIYMSPEGLIHNIYGPKTDIWAFGVLIYELLHGETPFAQCRSETELKYNVSIPITSKKMKQELSPQIKEIITLCMEIDESKRITAMDLESHPYFRRLMEKSPLKRIDSSGLQKKISTSQKYLGNHQQSFQRHNFLAPKEEDTHLTTPYNKKSPLKMESRKQEKSMDQRNQRGFSTQKNLLNFPTNKNEVLKNINPQLKQQTPFSQNLPKSKIFSNNITFKQCVNILHYCRLIYKYIIAFRQHHFEQQMQITILSNWLMVVMQEIKVKINENGVMYEGENAWMKEKKLREVTNEYAKKYRQELNQSFNNELDLAKIFAYTLNFYDKMDDQIGMNPLSNWVSLAHYMVMIVQNTNLLKNCYEDRNYHALSNAKQLQQFLNRNKNSLDVHSYKIIRKKVSFIRQKNMY